METKNTVDVKLHVELGMGFHRKIPNLWLVQYNCDYKLAFRPVSKPQIANYPRIFSIRFIYKLLQRYMYVTGRIFPRRGAAMRWFEVDANRGMLFVDGFGLTRILSCLVEFSRESEYRFIWNARQVDVGDRVCPEGFRRFVLVINCGAHVSNILKAWKKCNQIGARADLKRSIQIWVNARA